MRLRPLLLTVLFALIPTAALANGFGPPFATPPSPDVPVGPVEIDAPPAQRPPVAAPPFDLALPDPVSALGAPDLDVPQGPPVPLPGGEAPAGLPDLLGAVALPDVAEAFVLENAPPFGGAFGSQHRVTAVPEPNTALLLLLGLSGLALRRAR